MALNPLHDPDVKLARRLHRDDLMRRLLNGECYENHPDGGLPNVLDLDRKANGERFGLDGEYEQVCKIQVDLILLGESPLSTPVSSLVNAGSSIALAGSATWTDTGEVQLRSLSQQSEQDSSMSSFYMRQLALPNARIAKEIIIAASDDRGARHPNLHSILLELDNLEDDDLILSGPVYIRYFGATVASTPAGRLQADLRENERRLFGAVSKAAACKLGMKGSCRWEVFCWEGLKTQISTYEYRARWDLQAVERAMIAITAPLNLNTARGGFRHIPDLPLYSRSTLLDDLLCPPTPSDADIELEASLRKHLEDGHRLRKALGDDICLASDASVKETTRQLVLARSQEGRVRSMQLSSDITIEALEHRHEEIHYTGRLAGPGPSLTCRTRLAALGLDPEAAETAYDDDTLRLAIGPFTDIFPMSAKHGDLWLEMLLLARTIHLLKPTIIRAEGREAAALLTGDFLHQMWKDSKDPMATQQISSFLAVQSDFSTKMAEQLLTPRALSLEWESLGPVDASSWVGSVVIARVGPASSDVCLVVSNYHSGTVKYTPQYERELANLIALGARVGVIAEEEEQSWVVESSGRPGIDKAGHRYLEWLQTLRSRILNRVEKEGIRSALDHARKELRTARSTIKREWQQGASPMSSDEMSARNRANRLKGNLRHPKAAGPKGSQQRHDQYQSLRAADEDASSRGLLSTMKKAMPRRSVDVSDEAHLAWWLAQEEGLDLCWAASNFDSSLWMRLGDSEQRQALYQTHLAAATQARVVDISGQKTPIEMARVLCDSKSLYSHTTTEMLNQIIFCASCGASSCGGPQSAHTCAGVEEAKGRSNLPEDRIIPGPTYEPAAGEKAPRRLRRLRRSRASGLGVLNWKLVFAHQLWQHEDLIDMSSLSQDALAQASLIWVDPSPLIRSAARAGRFIGLLPSGNINAKPVLVHKDCNDDFILTAGVYRLIEETPTPLIDWEIQAGPGSLFPLPSTLNYVIPMLNLDKPENNKPIRLASYAREDCPYLGLRRKLAQHHCVDGTRPGFRISTTQVAFRFSELPRTVQLRLWLAHRNPNDKWHHIVPAKLFDWHVQKPSTIITQRDLNGAPILWEGRKDDGRGVAARAKRKANAMNSEHTSQLKKDEEKRGESSSSTVNKRPALKQKTLLE